MAKRTGLDRKRKLHLDLSELANARLDELQIAYPFASKRALATHVLEHALKNALVPSGMPPMPFPKKGADK